MGATKKTARIAGLIYLLFVIAGLFSLMYVPGKLLVKGDAAATVSNLIANQSLVRLDLAVGLVSTLIFLMSALMLYQLLKDVNHPAAALMVILVLIQLPQGFVSQLLQFGALELARGEGFLSAMDKTQRESLAMLCFHLKAKGEVLSQFFWGVWLFPLGFLVYRSGFLPRFLGVWLLANGVAYVGMCFMNLFLPQYNNLVFNITLPAMLGEMALMVVLLYVGFRRKELAVAGVSG